MPSTCLRAALGAALLAPVLGCNAFKDIDTKARFPRTKPGHQQALPQPPVVPVEPAAVQDPLTSILRYEAARSDGDGFLQYQLARGEPRLRERAAFALGRLPFPEFGERVSSALIGALDDEDASVRAATAFALGLRGDPATAAALAARFHGDERDEQVRARLVEAASRIDDPRARAIVLDSLYGEAPLVRQEAVLGPSRWKKDVENAAAVEQALGALVTPRTDTQKPATDNAGDLELQWRALFTLARRKSELTRAAFLVGLGSSDARSRLAAAQGLANLPAEPESTRKLAGALGDHDWRVVCEALVALGKHPDAAALDAMAPLVAHPSPHVRRALFESLGSFKNVKERALGLLEKARVDASPNVRAAAIEAGARLVGDECAADLELRRMDKDPRIRAGAASAAAQLSDARAVPLLVALSRDSDLRTAGIAVEGLGKHLDAVARERLHELVESGDNGLALTAVEALATKPLEADLAPMEAAWRRVHGDISNDVKVALMKNAGELGSQRAGLIVGAGQNDTNVYVRARAREIHDTKFKDLDVPVREFAPGESTGRRLHLDELPVYAQRPRVEILTTRGSMVFELFPDETPLHVQNFLGLARSGAYNGTPFHRVVPDFVIQGGDYRGDGNGSKTWDGGPLPAEFTPRKFVKGSLGMPRSDDPDSGGGQIFVTHRETPHLDGRYTLFGQLVQGADVLDSIEVGDLIRGVKLLAPGGSR